MAHPLLVLGLLTATLLAPPASDPPLSDPPPTDGALSALQTASGRVWLTRGGEVVIASGATIQLRCPAGRPDASWANGGTTDGNGTYEFEVPSGACEIRVRFQNNVSDAVEVFFSGDTRVNLELLPGQGDGWRLRRR